MWADGRAKIKAAEDKAVHDADSVVNMLDKPASIDADGHGDMGDVVEEDREYPIMMKMDTEGFSALAVQARDGHVLAGLSDCSVVMADLTREVILYIYKGHEDLVRGVICLMDKGLLVTAGWDHSVRVWLLQVIVTVTPLKASTASRCHARSHVPSLQSHPSHSAGHFARSRRWTGFAEGYHERPGRAGSCRGRGSTLCRTLPAVRARQPQERQGSGEAEEEVRSR